MTKLGVQLVQGITSYFDGDYNKSVDLLSGIMAELQTVIQGSTAQKDVFRQILLDACIRSDDYDDYDDDDNDNDDD